MLMSNPEMIELNLIKAELQKQEILVFFVKVHIFQMNVQNILQLKLENQEFSVLALSVFAQVILLTNVVGQMRVLIVVKDTIIIVHFVQRNSNLDSSLRKVILQ